MIQGQWLRNKTSRKAPRENNVEYEQLSLDYNFTDQKKKARFPKYFPVWHIF